MTNVNRRTILAGALAVGTTTALSTPIANAATGPVWSLVTTAADSFTFRIDGVSSTTRIKVYISIPSGNITRSFRGAGTFTVSGIGGWTSAKAEARNRSGSLLSTSETIYAPSPIVAASGIGAGYSVVISEGESPLPLDVVGPKFDKVIESGGDWVRLTISYWMAGNNWQDNWYGYDWRLAQVVEQFKLAKAKGLKISCNLLDPQPGSTLEIFERVNRAGTEMIAKALGPYVDVWQVLNEWNFGWDGTYSPQSGPMPVVNFFSMVAPILKTYAPHSIVSTTLGGYPPDQAQWNNWNSIYDKVGGPLDAIGLNIYPDPNWDAQAYYQTSKIIEMKAKYGKPLFVFETGASTPTSTAQNNVIVAVPRMIDAIAAGKPDAVFVYELMDRVTGSSDSEAVFGIYTHEGVKKPHWNATRAAVLRARGLA